MYLLTADTLQVSGKDYYELVREMKSNAWRWDDTKIEYMEAVAETVRQMIGRSIRTETCADFLHDLETANLITIELMH